MVKVLSAPRYARDQGCRFVAYRTDETAAKAPGGITAIAESCCMETYEYGAAICSFLIINSSS
jgi:hypothetical protein